jgi:hypothetical protein
MQLVLVVLVVQRALAEEQVVLVPLELLLLRSSMYEIRNR